MVRWYNRTSAFYTTNNVSLAQSPAYNPAGKILLMRMIMRIFMRMKPMYDTNAPKKPTNLSINSDLLRQAKELGIGLSAELEARLIERLAERRRQEWEVEVRVQIDAYNASVEQNGVFSDGVRGF